MRLAEREAERAAKRVKTAQEREAAKQLAMAQRGMTEEEKEVSRTIAVTFVIGKKRETTTHAMRRCFVEVNYDVNVLEKKFIVFLETNERA